MVIEIASCYITAIYWVNESDISKQVVMKHFPHTCARREKRPCGYCLITISKRKLPRDDQWVPQGVKIICSFSILITFSINILHILKMLASIIFSAWFLLWVMIALPLCNFLVDLAESDTSYGVTSAERVTSLFSSLPGVSCIWRLEALRALPPQKRFCVHVKVLGSNIAKIQRF